ncbi:hypothetical protein ACJVC5_18120 [Peredibacter sp. HCB2-198]|uniref:hypothetical protein n=1 Tax=Peredibacter sp. HCB2-198 TaxID=3383025 RepID=UPI0038B63FFF
MQPVLDFISSKDELFQSLFFAGSLFFLRQGVIGLMQLHKTGYAVWANVIKLDYAKRLQLLGTSLYVTFKPGKEVKEHNRAPTRLNENHYVLFLKGLEHGQGQFYYEELLHSFKAVSHINICLACASFSFAYTVNGIIKKYYPAIAQYLSLAIFLFVLFQLVLIISFVFKTHFDFDKTSKSKA